jgi:hypothetical protein
MPPEDAEVVAGTVPALLHRFFANADGLREHPQIDLASGVAFRVQPFYHALPAEMDLTAESPSVRMPNLLAYRLHMTLRVRQLVPPQMVVCVQC